MALTPSPNVPLAVVYPCYRQRRWYGFAKGRLCLVLTPLPVSDIKVCLSRYIMLPILKTYRIFAIEFIDV
ncbi:hypothetical protein SAMN05444350_13420 [Bacteroides stercorirosoris]|jgi:hypothetical protein|uniref:Uncharacterized protein n=1 Tax=Bacteroides stercorirosoris TaxID=871324 RepID=A0A1M6K4I4_9BACE|nr:hypothetical protein SAMN05444350_13420 [Bacteroides stercorirosoris]